MALSKSSLGSYRARDCHTCHICLLVLPSVGPATSKYVTTPYAMSSCRNEAQSTVLSDSLC